MSDDALDIPQLEQLAYIEGELRFLDGALRDFGNRHQTVFHRKRGLTVDLSDMMVSMKDARHDIALARDAVAQAMSLLLEED